MGLGSTVRKVGRSFATIEESVQEGGVCVDGGLVRGVRGGGVLGRLVLPLA